MKTNASFTSICLVMLCAMATCAGQAADKKAPAPSETSGPIAKGAPPCTWGATATDPASATTVWFGGTGGVSTDGALRTWLFKDGAWTRAAFESPPAFQKAQTLAARARTLHAAVANRYYMSESDEEQKVDLAAVVAQLQTDVDAFAAEQSDAQVKAASAQASSALKAVAEALAAPLTADAIARARAADRALAALTWPLDVEPQPRCYPGMVYEPVSKKMVLFGGEGIHGVYNDTWLYDPAKNTWQRAQPKGAPSPRLGHGMVTRDGKVYVVGGFAERGSLSYCTGLWQRLPMDVWVYDVAANTWTCLSNPSLDARQKKAGTLMQPVVRASLSEDGKTLSWSADIMSYGKKKGEITGSLDVSTAQPVADAPATAPATAPNTAAVRPSAFDPAWYEDVPPVDAAAVAEKLANLPANKWVDMTPPRLHVRRDWGTTVLDLKRDQLLHWAGGHSSHCGTDVAHYSIKTNRWHILYTPELPFERTYSNDGARTPSMSGRPWGSHTYLSYAYDAQHDTMIWAGRHSAYRKTNPCGLFTYHPATYAWSSPQWTIEGGWFDVERHKTCLAPTPHGMAVWADKRGGSGGQTGLWKANMDKRVFEPVVATDKNDRKTLFWTAYGDRHGMTYDSKRDRVLLAHFGNGEHKHTLRAVDMKSGETTKLSPTGDFLADADLGREITYLPDDDMVLACTRGKPQQHTLLYDCAKNAWITMPSPCSEPNKKGHVYPTYGTASGVEWDPKRKLLWHVDTFGKVYAMRFDRAALKE